jgi:hypothetical protein
LAMMLAVVSSLHGTSLDGLRPPAASLASGR